MDCDKELLRERTQKLLRDLNRFDDGQTIAAAVAFFRELRNCREYDLLATLADAVLRLEPKHSGARCYLAQTLIDTGKPIAALEVLQASARRAAKNTPEWAEASGLIGRAHKQIFFDSQNRASRATRKALKAAIAAYREPYEEDRKRTWHGVNLLALLAYARRAGIRVPNTPDPKALARELVDTLHGEPELQHDEWRLATLVEATLGLGDWTELEDTLREYANRANAFQLHSTLRQFTEIWGLEEDERGRGLVSILRARLLKSPGGSVELSREELQRARTETTPPQLEAILGQEGAKTYQWWKKGLESARSVASIRQKLGQRMGTGFLVSSAELGLHDLGDLLVMTNFHVVNSFGASGALRPDAAEVVFEAVDSSRAYDVELVWESPVDRCDAALLKFRSDAVDIPPLKLGRSLPLLAPPTRVYVIGHPGGRDLAFSLQDNELLDHEGPPSGQPAIPGVTRVHYRAPTEGGSSGSPVFNASSWEVIALHHMGGKTGMPKLNGAPGTYAANEGVAMQSIVEALRERSA